MCDVCVDFHDLLLSCKCEYRVHSSALPFPILNLSYPFAEIRILASESFARRNLFSRNPVDESRSRDARARDLSLRRNVNREIASYNLNFRSSLDGQESPMRDFF